MASVQSSAGLQPAVACYVCQLATIPGKFDPQKAAQLGVQRGPVRMHWGRSGGWQQVLLPASPYIVYYFTEFQYPLTESTANAILPGFGAGVACSFCCV
jgi:hypothetical protein